MADILDILDQAGDRKEILDFGFIESAKWERASGYQGTLT